MNPTSATLKRLAWGAALFSAAVLVSSCSKPTEYSSVTKAEKVSENRTAKPNFVWLISEDNSPNYLNLYSENGAKTPNIEALADNGLVFNQAFSNAPVCSVARTTLALGAYASRMGMTYHRPIETSGRPDGLRSVMEFMKDAGYFISNDKKEDLNFTREGEVYDLSKKGAEWRSRQDNQPFFHIRSFDIIHEKHTHYPVSDVKQKPTKHDPSAIKLPPIYPDTELSRYTHARYLDQHLLLDAQIGEVIAKLKEDGELENTFVFYFGDHGGVLAGSKGYGFDRSFSVPLVVRVPENFKHLVHKDMQNPKRDYVDGFVNFIDFAPTVLNLAGLPSHPQHDGEAFLGKDVSNTALKARDTSFGYADRFDEKYDFVRTIRKGNYFYKRVYLPFNPEGLYAGFRYKQAMMGEWRELYKAGKLNPTQAAMFEPRAVEQLYDISKDPHETQNLANEPAHQETLLALRGELQQQLAAMPDLGFYPEYYLEQHAFDNPQAFGKAHANQLKAMRELADLQLLRFDDAEPKLKAALSSSDEWQRYWALVTLTYFSDYAKQYTKQVKEMMRNDSNLLVRARAVQLLSMRNQANASKRLQEIIAKSTTNSETLQLLNIATMLHDTQGHTFDIPFRVEWQPPKVKSKETWPQARLSALFKGRIDYLAQ